MGTRSPLSSQGLVRRLTRAMLFGGGLALAVQGCDRGPTTTARAGDGPVPLVLSASVIAAPGAVVEAIVSFTSSGETTELSRDSVITDTGGADAALTLTANVSSCISGAVNGAACQLDLVVRLKRNGAVLDEATQRLTVTAETEQIAAAPVQLYEVASVSITGPAAALASLEPRDVVQLTATALDRNGATVAGRAATWSVVNGGVSIGATSGSMTANAVGAAAVRAAMGGRTQDMAVTVKQTSVDTVRVAPLDTSVTISSSFPYRITVKSGYGDVLTGRPLTYATSNATIATVSSTGVTTAVSAGTATITVRSIEGRGGATVTGTATLRVQPVATQQGIFSGLVTHAATGAPVAGASVAIRRVADNVLVATATTNTSGAWTSIPLPAGTYSLAVSATGFTPVTVAQVALAGGVNVPTTPVATVVLVPTGTGAGVISGTVRSATTNLPVDAATVELRAGANNVSGAVIASGPTNASGLFAFPPQPSGTYTIRVSRTGYSDGIVNVTVSGSTTDSPTIFLSPATAGTAWRFVLQWGSSPQDLDAHLTGPIPGSQSRFHVYFGDPGSLTSSPFSALDFDQTTGFGPETITIAQLFTGTYRFYVHNYSLESAIRTSSARVSVYQANTLVATYSPPQQDGVYWTVFEITNGTLQPINAIGNVTPSLMAPAFVGPRNSQAAREAAAEAEWYSLAPWSWQGTKRR